MSDTFKIPWTLENSGVLTIHQSEVEDLDDMELRDYLSEAVDNAALSDILSPQIRCADEFIEWAKKAKG